MPWLFVVGCVMFLGGALMFVARCVGERCAMIAVSRLLRVVVLCAVHC